MVISGIPAAFPACMSWALLCECTSSSLGAERHNFGRRSTGHDCSSLGKSPDARADAEGEAMGGPPTPHSLPWLDSKMGESLEADHSPFPAEGEGEVASSEGGAAAAAAAAPAALAASPS